jgi:hypothetical protein
MDARNGYGYRNGSKSCAINKESAPALWRGGERQILRRTYRGSKALAVGTRVFFEHNIKGILTKGIIMKEIMIFMAALVCLGGCASIRAADELNMTPDNLLRGDPNNDVRVKIYLQNILASPEDYEVKAYSRKPYSVETKKTLFMIHYYYVFFKNGEMEHTLVFTATPKDSVLNGTWMLDAITDVDSYKLFVNSNNPWEVEACYGEHGETDLALIQTVKNILERQEKKYEFFGPSIVRDLAWYHQLWMFLVPPPIITYGSLLVATINKDSCASAVLETIAWEK